MNRPLVLTGAIIVVAGVIMLAMLLGQATIPVAPVTGPPPDTAVQADAPSRLWSVVIGLTLALGAGLIGLGMNRWRSHPVPPPSVNVQDRRPELHQTPDVGERRIRHDVGV
jgi:hypothetical protein